MERNTKQFSGEGPKLSLTEQEEIFKIIKEDSFLPIHIQANGKAKKPSEFRKLLLTGATGHLGPHLLQQLSQQESLNNIFCLVRASSVEKAKERVIDGLKEANLLEKTNVEKLSYILGDVAQQNLGLDQYIYDYLANTIDSVVHNAAYTNHLKSYPISNKQNPKKCPLRSVNVTGVKNVLEFASAGQTKHILHSSSYSLMNRFNSTDGWPLEELPEEDNLGDGIIHGYSYSKFVGEKLIRAAIDERGIPVTVIRYPLIVGDSTSGLMPTLDNVSCVILSMWSCGFYPEINFGVNIIPVDTCANIASKLFFNDAAATGVYNLSPNLPATIEDFRKVASQNGITPIRKSTYEEYFDRILNDKSQSNESITVYKSIYRKTFGLREFLSLTPAMHLMWNDPVKLSGISPKLEKYVPGYIKTIPSAQTCVQNILTNFCKNSDRLPQLGINAARKVHSGPRVAKAAFLSFLCLVKSDSL